MALPLQLSTGFMRRDLAPLSPARSIARTCAQVRAVNRRLSGLRPRRCSSISSASRRGLKRCANPLVREAFFSEELPEEQLVGYWKQMRDDSCMAFLDMVALDRPKPEKVKTPMLVLGVGRDNMLKPSEIEATARAYHTQPEIVADVPHNSMLEPGWQNVAERILVWLNELQSAKRL